MRRIAIESGNMAESILGKATRVPIPWWKRRGHVLVRDSGNMGGTRGYAAVLTAKRSPSTVTRRGRTPVAWTSDDLGAINDGDILFIQPVEGTVSVLYEVDSPHNVLFATGRCNCSCIMCPQPPTAQEESLAPFNRCLIEMMAPGPEVLAITGGEPTLLRDEFLALLETCKRRLPKTSLAILTNGRLFKHREYVEALAGVEHPSLLIAVPLYSDLDSVHDHIVGADGAFGETVAGLHNLALYGMCVELRTVVLKSNYRRLQQFAEFAYRNLPFVAHVAVMGLEPTGKALDNLEQVWIDPYVTGTQLLAACEHLWQRMVPISLYNHQLCVIPERLWPLARRSISGWKSIYLTECAGCSVRELCCGLFESATATHSEHIRPIKKSS